MEDNFDILNSLKKRKKPELPIGFFDNNPADILKRIDTDDQKITSLDKKKNVTVPEGFFENFSANLMDRINSEEASIERDEKPKNVLSYKIFGFVSAVAACMLVFFMFNSSPEANELAKADIQQQESVDDFIEEDYLAYLDEAELIDFLVENEDIALGNELSEEEEAVYYLMTEDLEELYLEELQ